MSSKTVLNSRKSSDSETLKVRLCARFGCLEECFRDAHMCKEHWDAHWNALNLKGRNEELVRQRAKIPFARRFDGIRDLEPGELLNIDAARYALALEGKG